MHHNSRVGAVGVGLIIGFLSIARAEAAEISTGPVRVKEGNEMSCITVNAGAANTANVGVRLFFRKLDGTDNGAGNTGCGTLSPGETCPAAGIGNSTDYSAFCEITYPGGRIRGTLCNVTLGLCSNAD